MTGPKPLDDTTTLGRLAVAFLDSLYARGYSNETASTWRKQLRRLVEWCSGIGLADHAAVTRAALDDYLGALREAGVRAGRTPSPASRNVTVTALRQFFRWLYERGFTPSNPAATLERVRTGQRLPRHVLSAEEAERVLSMPRVSRPLGLRDRAILEVLYSTGVRRAELTHLDLQDLDRARGYIVVRAGKFNRDRIVPIGERAITWADRYLTRSRPKLLRDSAERALFVGRRGERLSVSAASHLVNGYVRASMLGKEGACHLFRHTMATVMLENCRFAEGWDPAVAEPFPPVRIGVTRPTSPSSRPSVQPSGPV